MPRFRLPLVTLLLAVGLTIWLLVHLTTPIPAARADTIDGASIHFATEDARVYLPEGCISVSWEVEGVLGVLLNGEGVIGTGEREICAADPTLTIMLPGEIEHSFTLLREIALANLGIWLMGFTIIVLLAGAIWLSLYPLERRPTLSLRRERVGRVAKRRPPYFLLTAVILLGVAVRVAFLLQPMRVDESRTYLLYVSQPLSRSLADYSLPNNHPFHTLLAHLSTHIFGQTELALRFPAFVAGILIIPATYVVGARLYNRTAGLIGAALTTVSAPLILYSTNARGYTLITLLFLFLLALAIRVIQQGTPWLWGVFSVVAVLMLYVNPAGLYPFGVVIGWMLVTILLDAQSRRYQLVHLIVAGAAVALLTALLYMPLVAFSGADSLTSNPYVQPQSWTKLSQSASEYLREIAESWQSGFLFPVPLLLGASVVLALIFHRRLSRIRIPVLFIALLVFLAMMVLQRVLAFHRVWLFLLPVLGIMAGAGLFLFQRLGAGKFVQIIVTLVVLSSVMNIIHNRIPAASPDTGSFLAAESIVLYLQPRLGLENGVVASPATTDILSYYFGKHHIPLYFLRPSHRVERLFLVLSDTQNNNLERLLNDRPYEVEDYGEPELIQQFDDGAIYLAEHK